MLGLSGAIDAPESVDVFNSVAGHAQSDPDIHLYFSCDGLPTSIDRVVNAFQAASRVLLQKSTREGFGLTVTEAMWKGKPMIGGNVGGYAYRLKMACPAIWLIIRKSAPGESLSLSVIPIRC